MVSLARIKGVRSGRLAWSIGVGTVVFALGMGPMVKFGLRRLGYTPPVAAAIASPG